MSEFKLEKKLGNQKGYYYLSEEDSEKYDRLKDSEDEKDKLIVRMLLEKARLSRCRHESDAY